MRYILLLSLEDNTWVIALLNIQCPKKSFSILNPPSPSKGTESAGFFVTCLLLYSIRRLFVSGEDDSGGIIHNDV